LKITSAVLTEFGKPLEWREEEAPALAPGEALIRLTASGICGSDVHIWSGRDPRIRLPLVLGHEGVGVIEELAGEKRDLFGRVLQPGDPVIWDRGVTCDECYLCAVKRNASLCPHRQVYGISRDGCYSTHLKLIPHTKILKLEGEFDPAVLVPAVCSGATVAHAIELVDIQPSDVVVVQGPGPLGVFAVAFARERGARKIIVSGMAIDRHRLQLCTEFGADATVVVDETTPQERLDLVHAETHGLGAPVVMDCTGSPRSMVEGIRMTAPGGIYALPGVATPIGDIAISMYEDVARRNVRLQGVWVSDTRHFYESVQLVLGGRYPFEKLITHRLPLGEAMQALHLMETREAIKAVLLPEVS
jgi:threonine dehydrogenase-like Zn-dependent dehydrogenase